MLKKVQINDYVNRYIIDSTVFFSVMNILTFLTASLILFKTMPSTLQETLTVFPRIQVIPHEYVRILPYKAH